MAAASVRAYRAGSSAASSSVARLRLPPPSVYFAMAPRRASVRVRAVLAEPGGLQRLRREPERPETGFLEGIIYEEEEEEEEEVSEDKVEGWIKESVSEIVRHIGEAPFLVHLFQGSGGASGVTLQREPASPGSWPEVKRRWGAGEQRKPDGIILVEDVSAAGDAAASPRKTWGLVVQGRGMDCVACYVLDTCRVRSAGGLCCTHFCLARAQCFGDPLELQLRNAWLQRLSR